MSRAFLGLGSNLGDRLAYLRSAVAALGRGTSISVLGVSKVYETEPVEVEEEQPDYLNCVVEMECGIEPVQLLRYCQGIEAALGRERKGEKSPRTVDVDVLMFEEAVLSGRDLMLPHPGITRAFNLKGLADLAPRLYIPGYGVVGELLADADLGGVREFGEDI